MKETWKVVYNIIGYDRGRQGVALVEAENRQVAMYNFQREYAGQYSTIDSVTKLLG